ncbi:unnamed protein product [Phytomonas sp. EM1]|nr:unnamed protein product [Phytomonas sp. EM1]|eukprot:CCW64930.1 unnamed protein product [Phytomonas sp. isolate EM1]
MLRCATRTLLATKTVPLKPKVAFQLHTAGRTDLEPLPTQATYDPEVIKKNLEFMLVSRRMELMCDQCYKLKKIRGFCHLYIGQEAIPAGMDNVLTRDDCVVTSYRDHCWYLSRGGTVEEVFGELFGRTTGGSKGKGGSMHMYMVKNNFYGGNAIVGAQVPLGAGLGWRFAMENRDAPKNVAVTLYGDGAANQGQVHEAMNFAALQRVPVIFAVENNKYGMGTSSSRASFMTEFYRRGNYLPGLKVDGMDLLAIQEGTRWAKNYCLSGKGPVVLELDCYRYVGHSMSDPDSVYRSKSEIQKTREERDCITALREFVVKEGIMSDEEINQMEKQIKKDVDVAMKKAEKAALPDLKELFTNIYPDQSYLHRTCQGDVYKLPGE